jgi:hypothetical protein
MSEDSKVDIVDVIAEVVEKNVEKVVEEVIVEKTEEAKEDVVLTFLQLFENFLSKDLSNFNIKLTPEIQQYFLILCKQNPNLFVDFEKSIKQIILDNKIDTKDIPEIIVLVSKVHKILKENKGVPTIDPYEVIRMIIHLTFIVYIETNKVDNKQLIDDMLKIIDVSIDLAKLSPLKKNNSGCLFKCSV